VCSRDAGFVTGESMSSAIAVTRWFVHETRRVYSLLAENPETKQVRKLIDWIRSRGGETTARQLQQGPRQFRQSNDLAEKALFDLVQLGLAGRRFDSAKDRGPGCVVFYLLEGGNGYGFQENPKERGKPVAVATPGGPEISEAEEVEDDTRFLSTEGLDREPEDGAFEEI